MTLDLTFHGAAGTVTGSKALLEHPGGRLLVDCGLFQGFKHLRERNWQRLPFDPAHLDAVVLTHAHVDHTGHVPLLVKHGFRGRIFATHATAALCEILWPDAAHLQEEAAERANRRGTSKHRPAKPLFTRHDAEVAIERLARRDVGVPFEVAGATVTFRKAGHILGASMVLVEVAGQRVLFSGDVGRAVDPIHGPPDPLPAVDHLVLESTYGDRLHEDADPEAQLGEIVRKTVARGGHVIVPAFAVGRTQRVLFHLHRLREKRAIPPVPVFLNSPLADRATDIFERHPESHHLSDEEARAVCALPRIARTKEDSVTLNRRTEPCIILAGSGMATGGRVVHHIRTFAPHPEHTLLFTGFQAGGTRGDKILRGARETKIFGSYVPIRCEVAELQNLSAHADYREMLDWVDAGEALPSQVLLNHGAPDAADAFRLRLAERFGLPVRVPLLGDTFDLSCRATAQVGG